MKKRLYFDPAVQNVNGKQQNFRLRTDSLARFLLASRSGNEQALWIMNGEQKTAGKASAPLWIWAPGIAVLAMGLLFTFGAWRAAKTRELNSINSGFQLEAGAYARDIARELALFQSVLLSLRDLHSVSENISAEAFAEFVEKGMGHQQQVLGAFGFAQYIPQDMRPAYEGADRKAPIIELKGTNAVPAAERIAYFPLTYQSPANALGVPNNYDFGSLPRNMAAIMQIFASGQTAVGGYDISEGDGKPKGRYVFAPIMQAARDEESQSVTFAPVGFAVAVLNVNRLLDSLEPAPESNGMYAGIVEAYTGSESPEPLKYRTPLRVANEDWMFLCTASKAWLRAHQTGQPATVLTAGLVITGLLTGLLLILAGRTRHAEQLVREKTADLEEAGKLLREEMDERLRLEDEILDAGSRERQRLGRDLHDSLGQKLTGAQYLSSALAKQLAGAPAEGPRDAAGQINTILKDSVAQVRRIAKGLAPVELDDEGLSAALQRLCSETAATFEVDCEFSCEPQKVVIPSSIATHLYHIAQEAINNAIRHGKADRIEVRLVLDGKEGELTIQDNGSGISEAENRETGMGLRIMRHRATVINGSCLAQNHDDGGVRVICRFPHEHGGSA